MELSRGQLNIGAWSSGASQGWKYICWCHQHMYYIKFQESEGGHIVRERVCITDKKRPWANESAKGTEKGCQCVKENQENVMHASERK